MPRPKVRPENRRRAVKACLSCKISKIRCDAQTPCVACVRKGRGRSCVYSTDVQPSSSTRRNSRFSRFTKTYAEDGEKDGDGSSNAGQEHNTRNSSEPRAERQKVYVGAASSLSFLQFVREVVGRCVGPCSFTESETMNMMLEIPQAHQNESPLTWNKDEVAIQHRKNLIQASFEATSGILDLYDMEKLLEFLDEWTPEEALQDTSDSTHPTMKRMDLAVVCIALAIGGQCQESQASNQIESAKYFAQAQRIAFEGFLFDPSIDMIRIFLLMAFYLLGACHRNAACIYLGVAAKAASTLGLHQAELYSKCTPEEVNHRLRCWRSMKVLDTLVSAILGRTSSTLFIESAANDFEKIRLKVVSPSARSLESMYQLCLIIEQVQHQLPAAASALDFAIAERLLEKLGKWTGSLPEDLRNFTVKTSTSTAHQQNRELLVGATHVACSYYFTVAIITRPFLIAHHMAQLQSRGNNKATSRQRPNTDRIAKLAQACIEAATYMAHICADAVQSNMLHDNMCILKAWVFAAGLLLGFSLFVEEGVESTRAAVADAYNSSCVVLSRFARLSPQAEHYYGILNNFANAITRYHQQLAESRRCSTGSYVYQIFTISNTDQEVSQTEPLQDEEGLRWTCEDGTSGLCSVGTVDDFICMTTEEDETSLASFWDEISWGNQLSTFF